MSPDPSPADSKGPNTGGPDLKPEGSGRLPMSHGSWKSGSGGRGGLTRQESPLDLPKLEGFSIEGVLGRGATGTVFSGVQLAVDRPVAIKFLHPHLCSDKRAIIRLQREARAAARLGHPGIISAVDMGVTDGRWWYAMELVEGISLGERIEEKGTLTEREALRIFGPIVDALQHAHGMGVIHRDVKPANILLDANGRARLVDLGLAWAETDPRVTSGGTLGTPHYISPEQARNPSEVDGRSDIWSLGATMFHALTGRPPFVGNSVAEVLAGVLHQPMPDPRSLMPGLSRGMSLVLRKCLSRDPNLRYRTPLELLKDLERMRERRSPKVRSDELEPLLGGPGRFLRPLGLAILVLVAAGGWIAYWQPWAGSSQDVVQSVDLRGWPALDEVRRGLESGQVSLRRSEESLALLVSPAVGGAPPPELQGEFAQLRLVWDQKLDAALGALLTEARVRVLGSLSSGNLAEASQYLGQDFPHLVTKATGYSSIEECPPEFSGRQHALLRWQGLSQTLGTAKAEAFAALRQDLERHRREILGPQVQTLMGDARFLDALGLLSEPKADWLKMTQVIADGLLPEDLEFVLASDVLRSALYSDRDAVRNRWQLLDGELVAFLVQEAAACDGEPMGATLFKDAWAQALVRKGIQRSQLPPGASWRSLKTYSKLLGVLDGKAQALQRERASVLFQEESARSTLLASQRGFALALDIWERVLEQDGPAAQTNFARLRQREMELLSRSMTLVADVIHGSQELTLEVKGIPRRGQCSGTEDPLHHPFQLADRVTGVVHSFSLTEIVPLAQGMTLVSGSDVEGLLLEGLSHVPDPTASLPFDSSEASLSLALLRYFLGDPAGVPLPFRDEVREGIDGDLWADLERRVTLARAVRENLAQERAREMQGALEQIRKQFSTGMDLRVAHEEFLLRYGDLVSLEQRQELDALLRQAAAPPPRLTPEELFPGAEVKRDRRGSLEHVRFDFAQGSSMGWSRGLWSTDGDGLVLRGGTPGDEAFLRMEDAAHFDLAPAFDLSERLVLRFHVESIDEGAAENELCLSVAGMSVFFVDRKQDPFIAYTAGDLPTALADLRRGKLRSLARFEGFPRTQPVTIEISFQPRTMILEHVIVGGERLSLGGVRRAPGGKRVGTVAIRSRMPLRVLWVELEGHERD